MNREERERMLDGVLDRALGPQAVEPRPGFEERILANLPAQPEARPWWRWMWVPALAAAAVLAVVIGMRVMPKEEPQPQQVRGRVETPKQEAIVKPEAPAVKQEPSRMIAKRTAPPRPVEAPRVVATAVLPRMDVFPAPVPENDQERLLRALSTRQRQEVEVAALEQAAAREKVQKYFETGRAPEIVPFTAANMR